MTKVFISHTSDLEEHPKDRSYIQLARDVITRRELTPVSMGSFTAESRGPVALVKDKIDACDIFVGIIGFRWGSAVPDLEPRQSFTQFEHAHAREKGKTRLIFLLTQEADPQLYEERDKENDLLQAGFRAALLDDKSATTRSVKGIVELVDFLGEALERARRELKSRVADSSGGAPPYGLIHPKLREGRVIPFLGRAASLAPNHTDPPDGPLLDWHTLSARLDGRSPSQLELSQSLALNGSYPRGAPLELSTVAQFFEVMQGRELLDENVGNLHAIASEPRPVHTFLAGLDANLLVLTTSFDDLLERAFRAAGKPYCLIVHAADPSVAPNVLFSAAPGEQLRLEDPALLQVDLAGTSVIYKMHGSTGVPDAYQRRFVITEEDWVDFLVRIADMTAIPNALSEALTDRHFLFLGYSLADWNLRVLLSRLKSPAKSLTASPRRRNRLTGWAISRGVTELEREFWRDRGVGAWDISLDRFVEGLATDE